MTDYGCPECGYDGPHAVLNLDEGVTIAECGNPECYAEFEIPPAAVEATDG